MKRDYLLIISGIIPICFIYYILTYMNSDNRLEKFRSSQKITLETKKTLKIKDPVSFHGVLTEKNPPIFRDFALAGKERKVMRKDRSIWVPHERYFQDLLIKIDGDSEETLIQIAPEYTFCGKNVEIHRGEDKEANRFRYLGIRNGMEVTGYGYVTNLDPLTIQSGHSLCAESFEEYAGNLKDRGNGYFLVILFVTIPSLFLIYLGMFRNDSANRGKEDLET
ncbi:MAG: hypothetical protein KDK54_11730 [Leptospiraceae bacterium]|nr:hypothetical protein [Leptospiraceae bacterium]